MEELGNQQLGRWKETKSAPHRRGWFTGFLPLAASLALLVVERSPARADTDLGPLRASGEVTIGGRALAGDWGSSKFNEYRDLEPGLLGGGSLFLEDEKQRYFFKGYADFVGHLDQRYDLSGGRYNWFKIETYFEQFPNDFSTNAQSLYRDVGGGTLMLPESTQYTIQNAGGTAAQSAALGSALEGASHVDLMYKVRETGIKLTLQPLPELEMNAGYRLLERVGTRPWGVAFGSPGNNFVNVAAPRDERTHELTAGIGYNREDWNLRLDYLGSFFQNDIDALTVGNPLRLDDSTKSGSRWGRVAGAPDNSAHTLTLSGAVKLPVDFPARLAGTLSYSRRFQNEDFLPQTANSAILYDPTMGPLLMLPHHSLHGDVRTWLGNLRLSARPTKKLSVTCSYRIYDLDNRTPVFIFPADVLNDRSFEEEFTRTAFNDYRVQNANVDGAYRLFKNRAKLKLGFEWEQWHRSKIREVRSLNEYTGKTGLEVKIASWGNLTASYKFGVRRGSSYRTYAHLMQNMVEAPTQDDLNAFQSLLLRKFDEADRNHHQVDLIAQLNPRYDLTLTLTGSYTNDDYVHTDLGLRGYSGWSFGTDASYIPFGWLTLSPFYSYEVYKWKQASRWRPQNFTTGVTIDDPLNNWSATSLDRIFTAGTTAKIELIRDRLDLDVNYMIQYARGESLASGASGFRPAPPFTSTVDGGNAVNWPDLRDVLQTASITLNYHTRHDVTWHLGYAYEHFDLADYKTDDLQPFMPMSNINGSGVISPSTDVYLGDRVGGYDAHIIMVSATYHF